MRKIGNAITPTNADSRASRHAKLPLTEAYDHMPTSAMHDPGALLGSPLAELRDLARSLGQPPCHGDQLYH